MDDNFCGEYHNDVKLDVPICKNFILQNECIPTISKTDIILCLIIFI